MKLKENFLVKLASGSSTPGGGAAAALLGVVGVSMLQMVLNLTIGKKNYIIFDKENAKILVKLEENNKEFLKLINEDEKAFGILMSSYKLKKTKEKSEKVQVALKNALIPPYKMLELVEKTLNLSKNLIDRTNRNLISDVGVAMQSLRAASKSSWLNVLINLKFINDKTFCKKISQEGEKILSNNSKITEDIYKKVLKMVN